MYTELIFGAELKKETPQKVIDALRYMTGEIDESENFPFPKGRCEWLFQGSSYYFGVSRDVKQMWFDEIINTWVISVRSNIKNYEGEIEIFLEWIKPWIDKGSGARDMYAITMYEEAHVPEIYYLDNIDQQ